MKGRKKKESARARARIPMARHMRSTFVPAAHRSDDQLQGLQLLRTWPASNLVFRFENILYSVDIIFRRTRYVAICKWPSWPSRLTTRNRNRIEFQGKPRWRPIIQCRSSIHRSHSALRQPMTPRYQGTKVPLLTDSKHIV